MRGRIVVATLGVWATTAGVGALLVRMIQRSSQVSAERELGRQATVTARLIEEDFADIDVSPGRITREEYRTYRNALGRSLDRARDLGGHDVVEASLQVGAREFPNRNPCAIP